MTGDYIALDYLDLAIAASLLLVDGLISVALRLGLLRSLTISATRMVVQLTLMGLILEWLFTHASPLMSFVAFAVMVAFAGREVIARQKRRLEGPWAFGLGASAMLLAAGLVTVMALTVQLRADPWYDPRYAIPLGGMLLGNTMTGVSLGLGALTQGLVDRRAGVEARLALGATRWVAMEAVVRDAVRTGLVPIVNAMAAAGVVFLPGMMTGQILAGVAPGEAIKYQLLIMFLIAGGTALGVLLATFAAARRLSDDRHRLRLDRLASAAPEKQARHRRG